MPMHRQTARRPMPRKTTSRTRLKTKMLRPRTKMLRPRTRMLRYRTRMLRHRMRMLRHRTRLPSRMISKTLSRITTTTTTLTTTPPPMVRRLPTLTSTRAEMWTHRSKPLPRRLTLMVMVRSTHPNKSRQTILSKLLREMLSSKVQAGQTTDSLKARPRYC